ncbi:LOW QUALITY PROTEIN: hypothetical protein RJ640_015377 [Escallonia rubra]|uniref:Uncharacterized protein n=1 Tax=Escallonia rubra TaxID=112253 RepID=A0AA88QVA4_9ASTE|nr:LOW QUALITY PROTEIN: hypothetical protein RJ640_015377 [Escallonia rubra]
MKIGCQQKLPPRDKRINTTTMLEEMYKYVNWRFTRRKYRAIVGEIDKNEFQKVMALMRVQNRQGARHRDGLRVSGSELLRLEFAHYDYNSAGTISAKDFALSMVASADMKNINKFLDRVDEITNEPGLRDIRVTFEEFKNFAELHCFLSMAIFSHGKVNGLLTKEDFQRAANHVCGISLTDNVVDMIFYGNLSSDEFLRVLQRREGDISQPREAGVMGLISCWLACSKNCSSSRILQ